MFIMDPHAEDLGDYQSQSVVTTYARDRAIGWSPGPVDRVPFGHTILSLSYQMATITLW